MKKNEYIAHSKDPENGIMEDQSFYDHTINVYHRSLCNLEKSKRFISPPELYDFMHNVLSLASLPHDMGKIDDDCQKVMRKQVTHTRMLNHVDAGTAFLIEQYLKTHKNAYFFAALVVNAHHIGLQNLTDIIYSHTKQLKPNSPLRDIEIISEKYPQFKINTTVKDYVDGKMSEYVKMFEQLIPVKINDVLHYDKPITPLTIRMMLSFLVDADHSDTANNYKNAVPDKEYFLLPIKRAKKLDEYIEGLKKDDERSLVRQIVYNDCVASVVDNNIAYCSSEVGTGKTTAVMRHVLKIAEKFDLRRIIWVSPLISIVSQVSIVFRNMILDGEDADEVVAENHCKVEYDNEMARIYSVTWNSPIISTTSVQLQTTLLGRSPGCLRKLHNIIGAAIVIDESHLSLIIKNWKIMWPVLVELTERWGCKILLISGSTVKIWEIKELVEIPMNVPSIMSKAVASLTIEKEKGRVPSSISREYYTPESLIAMVRKYKGPKLIVLNTIQNAAAIAYLISKKCGRDFVEHMSNALNPKNIEMVLEKVKGRLRKKDDFILVATSCAETGIDFSPSFQYGFREMSSFLNLMQFSGRINRAYEYEESGIISFSFDPYCFTKNNFHDGKILTYNDQYTESSRILIEMFAEGKNSPEYSTEAVHREIKERNSMEEINKVIANEKQFNFKYVQENYKALDDGSIPILVEQDIIDKITRGERVSRNEFSRSAISLSKGKYDKFKKMGIKFTTIPRKGMEEVQVWSGEYDADFLGYMVEIIKMLHL